MRSEEYFEWKRLSVYISFSRTITDVIEVKSRPSK